MNPTLYSSLQREKIVRCEKNGIPNIREPCRDCIIINLSNVCAVRGGNLNQGFVAHCDQFTRPCTGKRSSRCLYVHDHDLRRFATYVTVSDRIIESWTAEKLRYIFPKFRINRRQYSLTAACSPYGIHEQASCERLGSLIDLKLQRMSESLLET